MLFANRVDAGRRLGERVRDLAGLDPVVLGLPRGGVPVAFEVARALGAPLDVIVVRKIGVPFQAELAMGAIGEDGVRIVNDAVVRTTGVTQAQIDEVEERERRELARRAKRFRGTRARISLGGRTALIVDDGIATGSTVRAACKVARAHGAARVIVATPVAPPDTVAGLQDDADDVIALFTPERFAAIGQFYADFSQTSDAEVVHCLAWNPPPAPEPVVPDDTPAYEQEVEVRAGGVALGGHLMVPVGAREIVVFAHGSGSSRHSPRNQFVAGVLNAAGLGTLLFDLLTPDEDRDRANVFDLTLLGRRLVEATAWVRRQPFGRDVAIGYFGGSTGAGAALWAAAEPGADIAAVVSRGGRPDLAGARLGGVRAPTLLIVGENDAAVLELTRDAQAQLRGETRLTVVPGASHLFEEPGALNRVAALARDWFVGHLGWADVAAARRT